MCANQGLPLVESQAVQPITAEKLGGSGGVLVEPGATGPQVSKAFQMHAPYVLEIQTTKPFKNEIFSFGRTSHFFWCCVAYVNGLHERSSKIFHICKSGFS